MAQVFISYSHEDTAIANLLYAWMREVGVDAWYDQTSMRPGHAIVDSITEGLSASDVVVIVLSEASVGSAWATYEFKTALTQSMSRSVKLFILKVDGCSVPGYLEMYVYVDIRKGYHESGLSRLRTAILEAAGEADTATEKRRIRGVLTRRMEAYQRKREPVFDDHEYDDLQRFAEELKLSGEEWAFVAILAAYKGLDLKGTVDRARGEEATVRALFGYLTSTAALRAYLRAGLILERLDPRLTLATWRDLKSSAPALRPDRVRFVEEFVMRGRTVDYVIELRDTGKADALKLMEVIRQAAEQLGDEAAVDYLVRNP